MNSTGTFKDAVKDRCSDLILHHLSEYIQCNASELDITSNNIKRIDEVELCDFEIKTIEIFDSPT